MNHKKEEKSSSSSIPTYVIKANLNCCEACPLAAKKKLLKLPGVKSVVIDREKSLVHVTGTVEPSEIITTIKKLKKMAELLSYSYSKEEHENSNSRATENIKQNHGKNQSGHKREPYKPRKEDCSNWSDHKREPYIPPKDESAISDAICTDIYCRIHPRNQSSKNSLLNRMMWHQPEQLPNRFHHGYPQPGYGYPREQYHSEPRLTYPGYDYPRERYHPVHYETEYPNHDMSRPMLGYDNFGEQVDEHNSRSCNFM